MPITVGVAASYGMIVVFAFTCYLQQRHCGQWYVRRRFVRPPVLPFPLTTMAGTDSIDEAEASQLS